MDIYASIDAGVLELFQKEWETEGKKSYKKYIDDVLSCIALTEALYNRRKEFNEFAIPFHYFSKIIKRLRPELKNPYQKYNEIMKDLTDKYLDVFIKGYHVNDDNWMYTYYTAKEKFDKIFFNDLHRNSKGYKKVNITKLAKLSKGVEQKKIYTYNGEDYTNLNEFCKKYIPKGVSCPEYNKMKWEIWGNSSVHIKVVTGLDYCIEKTEERIVNYVPENCVYMHIANANWNIIKEVARMTLQKKNDPHFDQERNNLIRICRELIRNENENGTVSMYYHEADYGRWCQHGNNLQLMKKEYRKEILNNYTSLDMDASFFSLLYNLAKEKKYKKETPYLKRLCENAKEYRHKVHEDLLKDDPTVEYEDVKRCFTAMGYGASVSVGQVSSAIHFNKPNILIDNVGKNNKYTAERLASHPDFKGLYEEVSDIRNFIGRKIKNELKKSGTNELTNRAGRVINIQSISPKKRTIAIVTFLIHGMEITALKSVMEYIKLMNPEEEQPIGLLLHDGIYIKNECMHGITTEMISDYIQKTINYSVKYSIE